MESTATGSVLRGASESGPPSPSKSPPVPPGSNRAPSSTHAGTTAPAAGTFLTVAGHLKRLAVIVTCRTADEFWPPADVAPPPDERRCSLGAEHSMLLGAKSRDPMAVGSERPVISIVSEGGLIKFNQVCCSMDQHYHSAPSTIALLRKRICRYTTS